MHIKNVYLEKELTPEATIRKFRIVQKEGKREVARSVDFYKNWRKMSTIGFIITACNWKHNKRLACWNAFLSQFYNE